MDMMDKKPKGFAPMQGAAPAMPAGQAMAPQPAAKQMASKKAAAVMGAMKGGKKRPC